MVIELAAILFGLNSSIVTVSSEIDVGNSNSPSQSVLVSRSGSRPQKSSVPRSSPHVEAQAAPQRFNFSEQSCSRFVCLQNNMHLQVANLYRPCKACAIGNYAYG